MKPSGPRLGLIPLLVLAVGLAGCAGLVGGDGTPTATPDVDQSGSDDVGDRSASDVEADDQTDDGSAGGAPMSPNSTGTQPETGTADSFSPAAHARALESAGSYTVEFTVEASGGDGSALFVGSQKADLDTGERYSSPTVDAGWRNISFQTYVPPDGETAYRHALTQTQSVPLDEAAEVFDYSAIGANDTTGEWPDLYRTGTGETALGPATIYGADSVDSLPAATREQYDDIESVRIRAWVDDDTDVIARYDYRLSFVEDGESGSIEMTFELTDLGSTAIDRPDWVPDE